ncbi:SDR family oxidoreductase [Frondihabitans australicus]|uniref:Short-subunit dehydrogenase n=1 Tax=Frondihabitans australicus TaxID=386892 RepID=A0A495IID0_9MICO|nr:SDR family oxidoreductase [Frondihabitans australicus]RKR75792.1 short-subunit dehydrogenase [Frondihabitans australicus]
MSRILITGASRGIGRGLAEELSRRGHDVVATARDVSALEGVPAELRVQLDVTDPASVNRAFAEAGPVDVLISNAGATVRAPLETVPLTEVARLFELNTFGALRVAQAVLPQMRERGSGRLVFVSSVQGRIAMPLIGPYSASKWALEAIAEGLAIETRHFGVDVQVFQPGAVSSGGSERASVFLDEDDPYFPLLGQVGGFRTTPVTVEEFATVVADALEADHVPFRVPVGEAATAQLRARKLAPEDAPFVAAPLDW